MKPAPKSAAGVMRRLAGLAAASRELAALCARRPYVWKEWLHRVLSPVELLLDRVRDLERRMS